MPRRPAALAALTLAAAAAAHAAPAHAATPTTGRLLVTLDHGTVATDGRPQARAAAASLVGQAGARIAGPVVPRLDLVTVKPTGTTELSAAAARLRRQPGVARVEVEHRYTLRYQPNDPALTQPETASGTPAGTAVQWWAQRTGLFSAWDITRGDGATVAVIDSGVDATHPELQGKIAGAVDNDSTSGDGPATTDEVGHGTHVASLACGAGDDGRGIVGSGFNCRLLVYKSDLSESSVAASIDQATQAGADAINMSFGTDGSQPVATAVREAIQRAVAAGVVLVAAAADEPVQEQGDPSNVLQPTGSSPDITQGLGLSVTAANFADQKASFAGFGTQVSLAAYGAYDLSGGGPRGLLGDFPTNQTTLDTGTLNPASPACRCRTTFNGDTRYAYVQGTSMAAPIVAGAAALVGHLNPDLSAQEVGLILKQTARRPSGGWTPELGWGILDAGSAVALARTIDRRAPASKVLRPKVPKRGTKVTVRLTGSDTGPEGVSVSGIAKFQVYRRVGGGKAKLVATSTRPTARVRLRRGAVNALFAVATDVAGNREAVPARPDVRVRVPRRRG